MHSAIAQNAKTTANSGFSFDVYGQRLKEMRLKSAAELVEQKVEETLTYYGYPAVHWRQIRTNNPLERIIREIRPGAPTNSSGCAILGVLCGAFI
jgi:transposase-like protein